MSSIYSNPQLTGEQRLRAVRHRLTLIQSSVVACDDETALSVEPAALQEAVFASTVEALELLEPLLEHMPTELVDWTPPADKDAA
jgi:hypothetical protein